ncbi:hypothetical protein GF327_09060 [Candidatus Woesearchaeota archaeon]|nr:hypothetical protein [Candidatus Woesearchaeota archaeon]
MVNIRPFKGLKYNKDKIKKFEDVIKKSDYISVHVPLNEKTRNLISKKELKMMKPSAMIINCARGGIIDEEALYDALINKVISGAALDVFENEPLKKNKFRELPNIVMTPHLGASTKEAQEKVAQMAAENIIGVFTDSDYSNVLNFSLKSQGLDQSQKLYLLLSNSIGRLQTPFIKGNIREIEIMTTGDINKISEMISLNALSGLFREVIDKQVSLVNVKNTAQNNGITIKKIEKESMHDFKDSITVKVRDSEKETEIKGTVFGKKFLRIIRINDYMLDFYPEKTLVLVKYKDKPDIIGKIGTVLGEKNININEFRTGKGKDKDLTIAAINLDKEPDKILVQRIRKNPDIDDIKIYNFR